MYDNAVEGEGVRGRERGRRHPFKTRAPWLYERTVSKIKVARHVLGPVWVKTAFLENRQNTYDNVHEILRGRRLHRRASSTYLIASTPR